MLTGEFVSVPNVGESIHGAAAAEPCAQLLREVQAPYGLWAVMGNHDYYTDPDHVTRVLRAEGIQVLANQSAPIESNGGRFWLAGVDDVLGRTADLDGALHNVPADEATICWHTNRTLRTVSRAIRWTSSSRATLTEAKCACPSLGRFYLPDMARKYIRGLYKIGQLTSLYQSRPRHRGGLAGAPELPSGSNPADHPTRMTSPGNPRNQREWLCKPFHMVTPRVNRVLASG